MRSFIILLFCFILHSCKSKPAYDTTGWVRHMVYDGWNIRLPQDFIRYGNTFRSEKAGFDLIVMEPPAAAISNQKKETAECPLSAQKRRARQMIDLDETDYFKEQGKNYKKTVEVINGRAGIIAIPKKTGEGVVMLQIIFCTGFHLQLSAINLDQQQQDLLVAIFKTADKE